MKLLERTSEPIEVKLHCTSRIRKWAFENAYTLVFLVFMFVITWIIAVVLNYAK